MIVRQRVKAAPEDDQSASHVCVCVSWIFPYITKQKISLNNCKSLGHCFGIANYHHLPWGSHVGSFLVCCCADWTWPSEQREAARRFSVQPLKTQIQIKSEEQKSESKLTCVIVAFAVSRSSGELFCPPIEWTQKSFLLSRPNHRPATESHLAVIPATTQSDSLSRDKRKQWRKTLKTDKAALSRPRMFKLHRLLDCCVFLLVICAVHVPAEKQNNTKNYSSTQNAMPNEYFNRDLFSFSYITLSLSALVTEYFMIFSTESVSFLLAAINPYCFRMHSC